MSQLSIKVSDKGEAMIATLQKEIFNRRRKKVTASQVVETLVESGAKSQSDKRYAASWKNLIKDIEKAAKVSEIHGNKPPNISADEWALILSHRTRKATSGKKASAQALTKKSGTKTKVLNKSLAKNTVKKSASKKVVVKKAESKGKPAKRASSSKVKATKVKTVVKKVASAQAKKATSRSNLLSKRIGNVVSGRPAKRARKAGANSVKA